MPSHRRCRSAIQAKLDKIILNEVWSFDGLQLSEVVKYLGGGEGSRPEKKGINFLVSRASTRPRRSRERRSRRPASGLRCRKPPQARPDPNNSPSASTPAEQLRLAGAGRLVRVSDQPLKYR